MTGIPRQDAVHDLHDTTLNAMGIDSSTSTTTSGSRTSEDQDRDGQQGISHESGQSDLVVDPSLPQPPSTTSPNLNQSTSSNLSEIYTALPGGGVILKRGMACTFCRRRKLRCSADRPTCVNCVRYSQPCEYLAVNAARTKDESEGPDVDPPYTNIFTDSPLPPPSARQIPPATERQRRRASLAKPASGSENYSRRNSIHALAQRTPTRPDRRPSLARNTSGSMSGPRSHQSPSAPPPPPLFYEPAQTQSYIHAHEHGHGQMYAAPTAPWERPDMSRHSSGSVLVSPSVSHPPIGVQYEQVAPVPPPIQYPAEEETAWYRAALSVNPQQQQTYPDYHQTPTQPPPQEYGHADATSHYPAYEGYQDQSYGSAGVPGAGRYVETMDHSGPSTMSFAEPVYEGMGQSVTHPSMATYTHPPGPYASQTNLAIQTNPMTMPIYHNTQYSTPSIDEGYRPGMVHEGSYHTEMSQQHQPIYDPFLSPSHAHPALYDTQATSHTTQPTPHSIQPTPYTFPHLPIPLPEYEHDRPMIPRSASNPNTNSLQLQRPSETPSEASITTTTVNVSVPEGEYYPKDMNVMYNEEPTGIPSSKVDKLSERLGEFFLGPEKKEGEEQNSVDRGVEGGERHYKKARTVSGGEGLSYGTVESDGLSDVTRNALLDVFFEHHRLFFDLSIPKFRSRLTFHDRRRPSLALLNAMYMWASRMSHAPNMPSTETHFYQQAIVHLDASAATGDRLMDCIRAAFLLSAFQYMNGRHHSGYLLCGHSAQLVKSCGLHRIPSTIFTVAPPFNPFLRNRPYLLPPPEDALELAERIHTFWAVFALDRSSSALTGFTSSFRDSDITTPWPRELTDIASGMVTSQDDVTVRDIYRPGFQHQNERSYVRWIKAITILERASKLVLLDPEDSSEHTRQWNTYATTGMNKPPGYLESPRYRVPSEFEETKFALETLIQCCGEDGVFPVQKKVVAEMGGAQRLDISPAVILFHHVIAATQTLLYDTNSLDAENTEALLGARRAVSLIKELPPLPIHAVDAFAPLTWVMVAKVLIKERYRLKQNGDGRYKAIETEVQCLIDEINRVGTMMPPSRMYAKGVEDLMKYEAPPTPTPPISQTSSSSYSQQSNPFDQPLPPPTQHQQWEQYPSTNLPSSFIRDMS